MNRAKVVQALRTMHDGADIVAISLDTASIIRSSLHPWIERLKSNTLSESERVQLTDQLQALAVLVRKTAAVPANARSELFDNIFLSEKERQRNEKERQRNPLNEFYWRNGANIEVYLDWCRNCINEIISADAPPAKTSNVSGLTWTLILTPALGTRLAKYIVNSGCTDSELLKLASSLAK